MAIPLRLQATMPPNPRALARALLLLTALVWGGTFVLVKQALRDASPLVFNLARMTIAAGVLVLLNGRALPALTRGQVRAGLLVGLPLALGYGFQTAGLARTTPSKSAFLTGLIVVFVPALGLIPGVRAPGLRASGRRRPPGATYGVWSGAVFALAGVFLLTTGAGARPSDLLQTLTAGDALTILGALAFAAHLLALTRIAPSISVGSLATLQIAGCTGWMLLMLPAERPYLHLTPALGLGLLLTGVLATAGAFTAQSFAQRHLSSSETALLLTFEPVFAAGSSALLLGERFSGRFLAGAALILLGTLLTELGPGSKAGGTPA